jgi:tRNA pseudouridine55 synthase
VGPFSLDDARTLEQLADAFKPADLSQVARRCFASRDLDAEQSRDVGFGRRLALDLGTAGPVAVFDERGGFLALYEQRGDVAAPVAVFV